MSGAIPELSCLVCALYVCTYVCVCVCMHVCVCVCVYVHVCVCLLQACMQVHEYVLLLFFIVESLLPSAVCLCFFSVCPPWFHHCGGAGSSVLHRGGGGRGRLWREWWRADPCLEHWFTLSCFLCFSLSLGFPQAFCFAFRFYIFVHYILCSGKFGCSLFIDCDDGLLGSHWPCAVSSLFVGSGQLVLGSYCFVFQTCACVAVHSFWTHAGWLLYEAVLSWPVSQPN